MANKWMAHVKKTMKKMSSKKKSLGKGWFKSVLKAAKSSYHKKGGAEEADSEDKVKADESVTGAMGGRRRRKTHRKRHH
jgi:hypothetical protein